MEKLGRERLRERNRGKERMRERARGRGNLSHHHFERSLMTSTLEKIGADEEERKRTREFVTLSF